MSNDRRNAIAQAALYCAALIAAAALIATGQATVGDILPLLALAVHRRPNAPA